MSPSTRTIGRRCNMAMVQGEPLETLYRAYAQSLLSTQFQGELERPVFGEGPQEQPLLMLIGEAPGAQEAKSGHPFVGKAGKQLDELLAAADIDRSQVFVTNAVKFRPVRAAEKTVANRTPSVKECRHALALLQTELERVRPRVVATLGNVPLRSLCWLYQLGALTVGTAHGQAVDAGAFALFPLYHPASVIYNRALQPVLAEDIRRLKELCEEKK